MFFHCCRTPWKLSFTTLSSTQKVSTCPLVPPTLPSRPPRYARKNYYFISFKFCNSLNLNFPHLGECKTYYFISFEFCNSLNLNFPHLGECKTYYFISFEFCNSLILNFPHLGECKTYYFISFEFCNSLILNFPHLGECKTYYFISFKFCNSLNLNFPHLGRVWRVLGVGWYQQAVPLQSEGPRLPSSGETAILFILKLGM